MKTILGTVSDQVGIEAGFSQRKSKVTGSAFMQMLLFYSLEDPELRYSKLVSGALNAGVTVTKQVQPIDFLAWLRQQSVDQVDLPIQLGKTDHLTYRLLAVRVPP